VKEVKLVRGADGVKSAVPVYEEETDG